ncbi:O-succinylhomoserine sulfhydrylase [Suttonella ornithocola]|uniref:O-succinylhomoserine sulfhydrylase n=1 Tax=Suttonella ornithocola TaxID=279832 RepID=A0A380N127_9GAMM|nr:O-succinylhomoserine sulfhydrylase [Suttonella ornithocola]SUO97601.1 O-succinylhomoserine sulfhydrylase [Suttonella ornithocola]
MSKQSSEYQFETQAIRSNLYQSPLNEHSPALFLTSSFTFENAQAAADIFAERIKTFSYSRFTNPTVQMFEQRMATLEGGARATATATGMGAILTIILAELSAGDHVVCSRNCFGSTLTMFGKTFAKFGVETTLVDLVDIQDWKKAIRPNTKLFFLESPANPLLDIGDIAALSDLAHQHGIKVVVDNCMATPYLQQPLALGADYSLHSATKYIDGQGRALGGVIVSKSEADGEQIYQLMRSCGTTMNAFEAWIFLKSLETLAIRMDRHCENAMTVARWLSEQPAVEKVYYPGLENHPQHALAKQQMPRGFGGMVSFALKGGKEAAWKVIDSSEWLSITGNLGDARTTITHPDTTTHYRVEQAEKDRVGITDGVIRLSVGLENAQDICQALAKGMA